MKRRLWYIIIATLALGVIGAGCSDQPASEKNDTANTDLTNGEATTTPLGITTLDNQKTSDSGDQMILLEATALGNNQIRLSWTLATDPGDQTVIRVVRSTRENPTDDGKTFWWETNSRRRDTVWSSVPAGTQHFRACIVNNNVCTNYSDDVVVEVR